MTGRGIESASQNEQSDIDMIAVGDGCSGSMNERSGDIHAEATTSDFSQSRCAVWLGSMRPTRNCLHS